MTTRGHADDDADDIGRAWETAGDAESEETRRDEMKRVMTMGNEQIVEQSKALRVLTEDGLQWVVNAWRLVAKLGEE
ncbi:hypothetical protein ACEPAH_701 [Sanghuangporus vaninii]